MIKTTINIKKKTNNITDNNLGFIVFVGVGLLDIVYMYITSAIIGLAKNTFVKI